MPAMTCPNVTVPATRQGVEHYAMGFYRANEVALGKLRAWAEAGAELGASIILE